MPSRSEFRGGREVEPRERGSWPSLPSPLRLPPGEVHVVRVALDRVPGEDPALLRLLSPDERARSRRFLRSRDRRRSMASGVVLRTLLGRYLNRSPAEIRLERGPHGKPGLPKTGPCGVRRPIHFNVSHCGDLGLYAFTRTAPVGVDVEAVEPAPDLDVLAGRFFTPGETAVLESLPVSSRTEGFYLCWTRKEAMLKATGEGLGEDLRHVEVTCAPDAPARIVAWRSRPAAEGPWRLHHLDPGAPYVGALAVRGPVREVRRWSWLPVGAPGGAREGSAR